MNPWDLEYHQQGIPSSYRNEPSGVLLWCLSNWKHLTGADRPETAIDVGCGTGRNTSYLASLGIKVIGFDSSVIAMQAAQRRANSLNLAVMPELFDHDLANGVPADDHSTDLIVDIFVYKHQLSPEVRAKYRSELKRVLRPKGRILMSLAHLNDGYYSLCDDLLDAPKQTPRVIWDSIASVGSVLFTQRELEDELSDHFRLELYWHKIKTGDMHGHSYYRHTIGTVWCLK